MVLIKEIKYNGIELIDEDIESDVEGNIESDAVKPNNGVEAILMNYN